MSMEQRPLGRTGADVSVVGLGTWQLGGDWGDVDDDTAAGVLDAALDAGVTLLDTADVYGDGRSEVRIRQALVARPQRPFVATKAGRRADPFEAAQYTPENLRAWIDRSRRNLGVGTLDLVQLPPPPPQPGCRAPRPGAAALPAAGDLRGRPPLRHPGRARRRGGDRRLRGVGG